MNDIVNERYINWLVSQVCDISRPQRKTYYCLLHYLHDTEFRYTIPNDENRAEDGIGLRYRFANEHSIVDILDYVNKPCSVLEMMVALALRIELDIMEDPDQNNRTPKWFWGMISSLGLGVMDDKHIDYEIVKNVVNRFLEGYYEPNGEGGLFTVKDCPYDLRGVEIWYQMNWYLGSIL